MQRYLIKNCVVVNEGKSLPLEVLIENGRIARIGTGIQCKGQVKEIDAQGHYLLPGLIDDQVHFREPGLTHKASLATEAKAAVAGGVTSYMEMPNTIPPVFTQELLEDKYNLAQQCSLANYSFYMGTSNTNAEAALATNAKKKSVCGIKIFMGSSTGGLLVDNFHTLEKIFSESEVLIATHCEDETIIRANYQERKKQIPELGPEDHPLIRNTEACYSSSLTAVQLAKKYNTRLHILHLTTAKELQLFSNWLPLQDKRITAEVCVHHLHFTSDDYATKGYLIKCNPAIKAPENKAVLWEALLDDRLDVIATDHAPHTLSEKGYFRDEKGVLTPFPKGHENYVPYEQAHAGLPLVQHSLQLMLLYVKQGKLSMEKLVEKMSHAVATCYQVAERGFIREGYHADLILVNPQAKMVVQPKDLLYKCGWSPLEQMTLPGIITHTFVNGHLVWEEGRWDESQMGSRLSFNR